MSIEENKITDILDELRVIAKKSKRDLKIVMTKDEIQINLSLVEKSKPNFVERPTAKKSKLSKAECGLTENELKFIEQYSAMRKQQARVKKSKW